MNRYRTERRPRLQLMGFMGALICGLLLYIAVDGQRNTAPAATPNDQTNYMQNEHSINDRAATFTLTSAGDGMMAIAPRGQRFE